MSEINVYAVPMPEIGQVIVKKVEDIENGYSEAESVLPIPSCLQNTEKEVYSVGWKLLFHGNQYSGITYRTEEEIDEGIDFVISTMNEVVSKLQREYFKENNHDEG